MMVCCCGKRTRRNDRTLHALTHSPNFHRQEQFKLTASPATSDNDSVSRFTTRTALNSF